MKRLDTPESAWKVGSVMAVVVLVGCVVFDRLTPNQDIAVIAKKRASEVAELERSTRLTRKRITESRDWVDQYLWNANRDEIGAQAMAQVDLTASQTQVNVQAFRPQRTLSVNGIDRHPYSVVVRGSYPRVVNLVRKFQAKGTNLALLSVLLSAADGESDTVTATIGLAAFSETPVTNENGK